MSNRFAATLTVPGRIESVRTAAAFLVETARSLKIDAAGNHLFEVAIVEAITNALQHTPRDGDAPLHCEIEFADRRLVIRVLDEAARAPLALAVPSGAVTWSSGGESSVQDVPESGYGLYLMRAIFPEVRAVTRDGRHGVELALLAADPAAES
jgi:anti-sigma regulatory factor (Ser/Thr protein kinase)